MSLFLAVSGASAKPKEKEKLPRLPGAVLLVGYRDRLMLTTPKDTISLFDPKWPNEVAVGHSLFRDGSKVVIAGFRREQKNMVIQSFSLKERAWSEYKELEKRCWALAVSPDGSKVAMPCRENDGSPTRIHILNLSSGEERAGPPIKGNVHDLSWSPDGSRIAYDVEPNYREAVHILDLRTDEVTIIPDAQSPAWSPSGEWIAFFHYTPNLWLMRPDGTDRRFQVSLGKRRFGLGLRSRQGVFAFQPVWSPDSKMLLLNELANADLFNFDIHAFDPSVGKLERRFKDTVPVHGWSFSSP